MTTGLVILLTYAAFCAAALIWMGWEIRSAPLDEDHD